MHIKCTREWKSKGVSRRSLPSPTPVLSISRRGRKLCRWRRKALINTTVSDRYADPRHCKMAAISPSHSRLYPPPRRLSLSLSLLFLSSLARCWTQGYFSFSPLSQTFSSSTPLSPLFILPPPALSTLSLSLSFSPLSLSGATVRS